MPESNSSRAWVAVIALLAIGLALSTLPVLARRCAPAEASTMNVRLRVGDEVLLVTLRDNEANRDFASLLHSGCQ